MLKLIILTAGLVLIAIFVVIPLICFLYFLVLDIYLSRSLGKIFKREKDIVKRIIQQAELLKHEATDWVSQIILSNPNARESKLAFIIRSEGSEISVDEKISLNLHLNTKVSQRYLEALTDKGKSDPLLGAENIAKSYLHSKHKPEIKEDNDEL